MKKRYRRCKAIQNQIEERMNQEALPCLSEAEQKRFVEERLKQDDEGDLYRLRQIEKQDQQKEQLEQLKEQLQLGKEIAWTEEQQNPIRSEYKQLSINPGAKKMEGHAFCYRHRTALVHPSKTPHGSQGISCAGTGKAQAIGFLRSQGNGIRPVFFA